MDQERREFRPIIGAENVRTPEQHKMLKDAYDYVDRMVDEKRRELLQARNDSRDTAPLEEELRRDMDILNEIRTANMNVVSFWSQEARKKREGKEEQDK